MARGWESKSIEQQQEMAASDLTQRKAAMTPGQIAEQRRREGLQLSRQQVLQQLQVACNPRRRQMLEAALADLDAKIGSLETEHDKIKV
jgi:hypothetical protein